MQEDRIYIVWNYLKHYVFCLFQFEQILTLQQVSKIRIIICYIH